MAKSTKKAARIAVKFGGVSIGDETARLGIKISREDVGLEAAVDMLCGRRITGSVKISKNNESPDQLELLDGAITQIDSVFDCKRLGVSPKEFSAGLTFSLAEIDVSVLAHFAKREGWLIAQNVVELVEEDAVPE